MKHLEEKNHFNTRTECSYASLLMYTGLLTAKLLRQGFHYFKLRKAFSKFYRRHSALVEKYNVSLKTPATKYIGTRILL